jgi:hypothetical protein
MPGIRFAEVRAGVTMAEVLGLVGFVPRETSRDQVLGPCRVNGPSLLFGTKRLNFVHSLLEFRRLDVSGRFEIAG